MAPVTIMRYATIPVATEKLIQKKFSKSEFLTSILSGVAGRGVWQQKSHCQTLFLFSILDLMASHDKNSTGCFLTGTKYKQINLGWVRCI